MTPPDRVPEPLAACCSWCAARRCPGCLAWVTPPRYVPEGEPPCCPRCRADLGGGGPGGVTHGICEACKGRLLAAEGLR